MAKFVINNKIFDSESIISVTEVIHDETAKFIEKPQGRSCFSTYYFQITFLGPHKELISIDYDFGDKELEKASKTKIEKIWNNVVNFWDNTKSKYPILDQED